MFGAPFAIAVARVTRPSPVSRGDAYDDARSADIRAAHRRNRYVRPLS